MPPIRCKFFPKCRKRDCEYIHPTKVCKFYPKCFRGDKCTFLHQELPQNQVSKKIEPEPISEIKEISDPEITGIFKTKYPFPEGIPVVISTYIRDQSKAFTYTHDGSDYAIIEDYELDASVEKTYKDVRWYEYHSWIPIWKQLRKREKLFDDYFEFHKNPSSFLGKYLIDDVIGIIKGYSAPPEFSLQPIEELRQPSYSN